MGALKRKRIKAVRLHVSDQKRRQSFAEQAAGVHLRFAERRMNELGLSREEKIAVLDGIIEALKARENSG